MTLVVADTGPLNYLHLIGRLEILPALYGEVSGTTRGPPGDGASERTARPSTLR